MLEDSKLASDVYNLIIGKFNFQFSGLWRQPFMVTHDAIIIQPVPSCQPFDEMDDLAGKYCLRSLSMIMRTSVLFTARLLCVAVLYSDAGFEPATPAV